MEAPVQRITSHLSNLRLALRFVWESTPGLTIVNLFLLVIEGTLPLAALILLKLLVDTVTSGLGDTTTDTLFEVTAWLILAMGGVALLSGAANEISTLVFKAQSQIVTDHMHAKLHAKSIEVDLEYYENSQYFDTLHRAQQDAPHRPTAILNSLLQIGQNGISLLAMGGLLFLFQWWVVLVLIVAALPDFFVRLRHSNQLYVWERQRTPLERKAWYLNMLLTRDSHAKELRIFDLGTRFGEWFQDVRRVIRRERLGLERRRTIATIGAQVLGIIGIFGVYFFVAYRTAHGLITIGELVMYFQAIQRSSGFLKFLGNNLSSLYENSLFLNNLEDFLHIRSRLVVPKAPKVVPRPLQQGLVFDQVSFHYPSEQQVALEDLSFSLYPGEHIALVGENGAGKTTLVKLLCRLYDPTHGRILLDGIDLREFGIQDLHQEISVIFQDFARYHMTAKENIGLGVDPDRLDHDQCVSAAQQAGIDKVIARLPQGYDTILGKMFEGGQELSIGEWQKVALARAFLRKSQILIMDEPTSAMDAKAEAELFERFHQLAKGRIAILISHRLSTVKMADRIFVLNHGRIVECGTHQELVNKQGTYAELFETQAQYYR